MKQRIQYDFDGVISVQDVGVFEPNSQVYRSAARMLRAEESYRVIDGVVLQL